MLHLNDPNAGDDQLIRKIIENDHEAFKSLYYKYYPLLIRFASYRLRSIDTARNLVQEVFFRIWMRREKLDPNKSIKAYLYKSLNNLIINHSRLASSQTTSIEDINEKKYINKDDMETAIDFRDSISKLPEKLKIVYLLSRVEGYKYNEIAEICRISVKAVEKRISKAFKILRNMLNN